MQVIKSIVASLAVCGTLAAGVTLAQTPPATPSNPHPAQTNVPPTTPRPATPPPVTSPTLPAPSTTAPMPSQSPELQRQQQQLRSGVKTQTDDSIQHNDGRPGNPAPASSTH